MKDLKLNISDSAKAAMNVPKVAPTTFVVPKTERPVNAPPSAHNNIANWSLYPDEKGIRAVNEKTQEVFVGTTVEFNNIIRGA